MSASESEKDPTIANAIYLAAQDDPAWYAPFVDGSGTQSDTKPGAMSTYSVMDRPQESMTMERTLSGEIVFTQKQEPRKIATECVPHTLVVRGIPMHCLKTFEIWILDADFHTKRDVRVCSVPIGLISLIGSSKVIETSSSTSSATSSCATVFYLDTILFGKGGMSLPEVVTTGRFKYVVRCCETTPDKVLDGAQLSVRTKYTMVSTPTPKTATKSHAKINTYQDMRVSFGTSTIPASGELLIDLCEKRSIDREWSPMTPMSGFFVFSYAKVSRVVMTVGGTLRAVAIDLDEIDLAEYACLNYCGRGTLMYRTALYIPLDPKRKVGDTSIVSGLLNLTRVDKVCVKLYLSQEDLKRQRQDSGAVLVRIIPSFVNCVTFNNTSPQGLQIFTCSD